jgi:hypothetical protein
LTLTPSGATASSPPTAATESTLVTVPQVATTVSAQIAAIGAQLTDSVVVTGLNGQQAQLKAVLYGPLPGDARSGCSQYTDTAWQVAITHAGATLTADTADVDVVGDGTYVTTPVRLTRPGCYTYRETLTPASTPETAVVTPLGVGQESTIVVTPDVHTVASSNQGDAGSLVRDHVLVSGTFGTSGTVSAELLGPVHDVHGSCAGLDWTNAPLAAALPPITTSGDGNYETAPTRLSRTGCYTFVESLLLGSVTTPFMHTPPGVPAETVLIRPPAPAAPHAGPPLARTGVPTLALVGGGVATVAGGGLVLLLGRRRER